MSKLRDALARKPNLHSAVGQMLTNRYGEELTRKAAEAEATLSQKISAVFRDMWPKLKEAISDEVKSEVAKVKIPAPQITKVVEQPITQVIERIIEQKEKQEDEKEKSEKTVLIPKYDADGLLVSVKKDGKELKVFRNKNGQITKVSE